MSWYPNGYVSGTKPTPERMQQQRRAHAVGMVIKDVDDATLPETGVTRFSSRKSDLVTWNKRARRYQYKKGAYVGGVLVQYLFTTAPPDAPPERRKGYRKPKKKGRTR